MQVSEVFINGFTPNCMLRFKFTFNPLMPGKFCLNMCDLFVITRY